MLANLNELTEERRAAIVKEAAARQITPQEFADSILNGEADRLTALHKEQDRREQEQFFQLALSLSEGARAEIKELVLARAQSEGKLPQ